MKYLIVFFFFGLNLFADTSMLVDFEEKICVAKYELIETQLEEKKINCINYKKYENISLFSNTYRNFFPLKNTSTRLNYKKNFSKEFHPFFKLSNERIANFERKIKTDRLKGKKYICDKETPFLKPGIYRWELRGQRIYKNEKIFYLMSECSYCYPFLYKSKHSLCAINKNKTKKILSQEQLDNPTLLGALNNEKAKYLLIFDKKHFDAKMVRYKLISLNLENFETKLIFNGEEQIDKWGIRRGEDSEPVYDDAEGKFLMDNIPLNELQTIFYEFSTDKLLLFDFEKGKLIEIGEAGTPGTEYFYTHRLSAFKVRNPSFSSFAETETSSNILNSIFFSMDRIIEESQKNFKYKQFILKNGKFTSNILNTNYLIIAFNDKPLYVNVDQFTEYKGKISGE